MVKIRNRRLEGKNLLKENEQTSLHLSEFSQGKPNELSLNVLENKLLDASSYQEINRRRRNRVLRRIAATLCGIGLLVLALWVAVNYIQEVQKEQASHLSLLETSLNYLEQTDATLVQMDEFFQTEFNDSTLKTAQDLQQKIPEAQNALVQARSYAQQAQEALDNASEDKEAAEHALNSIAARETMFSIGLARIAQDIGAKQALDAISPVQAQVSEANTLLSEASKVIADTTTENVTKSTEYISSAKESLAKAKESLATAKSVYPQADLGNIISYVDKRIDAADAALASNAAIVLQDRATAEKNNEAYNNADAEAARLAGQLPNSFSQPIIDAYQSAVKPLLENYDAARGDAGRSDANLREYLGVRTQG